MRASGIVRLIASYGGVEAIAKGLNIALMLSLAGLVDFATYGTIAILVAVELVLDDPRLISFGSTILKALFVLLPRHAVSWEPDSIISLYTSAHDPAFRDIGGSWPISLLSELVWDFYLLAPIAAIVLALLMAKLQVALLRAYRNSRFFLLGFLLFAYMHSITMARGSGIDRYLDYLLLGGACFVVWRFIILAFAGTRPRSDTKLCVES